MNKISLTLLVVAAALMLFLPGSTFCSEPPVKIGVIQVLTGDAANPGVAFRNGFSLAMNEFSEAQKTAVQFIFEDDQMQPKSTLSAYKRLRAIHDIQAVVTFSSGTSNALAPVAESDGVPQIAVGSDPGISRGRSYVMNFMTMPDTETKLMVSEALRRGYRRIARISTIQEGTIALRDAFDTANAGRIAVALDEEYSHDSRDFRPFIAKLKQLKDIDGIFANFLFGQSGVFSKQLREAGINTPIFSHHCFEDPDEVKISNGAMIGAWYVNPDSPTEDFLNLYRSTYPGQPVSFAAHGFDLANMLAEAARENRSRSEINKFIHSVKDFRGALGTFSSMETSFSLPATLKTITEKGFVKIGGLR